MSGIASIPPRPAPDLRDKAHGGKGSATIDAPPPIDGEEGAPPLHPGCPVQPLGRLGTASYYLDEMGQLVRQTTKDWNDVCILSLFGRQTRWLETPGRGWPKYGKPVVDKDTGETEYPIVGFDYAKCKKALIEAASHKGIFDPQGRVRGPGAHRGADGELILHCGDAVMIGGQARINGAPIAEVWHRPGLIGDMVYPTADALPRPDTGAASVEAGFKLLGKLKTWNWRRPIIDPVLMLGQIGALAVAGALAWHPHSWVTGGRGTGKSSLLGKGTTPGLVPLLFGRALIVTADATEAGLRQMTTQKTLPILFEELEPDPNNGKAKAVIELARKASSGADIFRGGSDHQAAGFKAETSFVFSSILIPPMMTQDKSRLAILELDPLEAGGPKLQLDRREWEAVGRAIIRRMVDQWHRFEATKDAYGEALAAQGHDARGQDQFGTLLACHDLLIYDGLADSEDLGAEEIGGDRFADLARHLGAAQMAEAIGAMGDDGECIEQLRTSFMHARGGDDRETVAQTIINAISDFHGDASKRARARERLQTVGLRIGTVTTGKDGAHGFKDDMLSDPVYLAVAGGGNVGLRALFEKSRWYDGGWSQSLIRAPGAIGRVKVRFAGAKPAWAVCVPISAVVSLKDDDEGGDA
jgi:hypothetical protein